MIKNKFNTAAWDIYDSTYIQVISLKNGLEFIGYSKKEGFAEKNDKQALLINWIIRMHKSGYLDANYFDKRRNITTIEYYLNETAHKKPILRLFYDYYEALDTAWSIENREVFKFLDNFYEAIKSDDKEKIKSLYIYKKRRFNDPFDVSMKRFITEKSLRNYCYRMIEQKKFTKEQAIGFHQRYTEKYFQ
ncbi:MAG: hypothetical protein CMD31_13210 [Flavobacteriales bacterium]|nr:hypothetical protein [Flavobacteriales bacterium]|tara:strand:- start:2837 stop:3406 length:570 start_codon:yes stop_codon:yes gene_type:complete